MYHLERLAEMLGKAHEEASVTFVAADRPHIIYPRLRLFEGVSQTILEMPLLNRPDCERIIEKLAEVGLLGALQGKHRSEQLREFLGRSQKQLLVAMKEATLGKGFDTIIANEFQSLSGEAARHAYTICCLTFMHGAPVRRRHLLACIAGTDLEKASVLGNDLREVIVPWRADNDFFVPRHRVIAAQVARETASFKQKGAAILDFLATISSDITPLNISNRTPEFIAYRGIANFDNILELFGEDYDVISEIYLELKGHYGGDFLFWLQLGRAELYFDHFTAAENYLKQSLGIREAARNYQACHHMGVLHLKRALFEENPAIADSEAQLGEQILKQQIHERGDRDSYPFAALAIHKLRYLKKRQSGRLTEELEELLNFARDGKDTHPFDSAMNDAYEEVYRAYLMQAVSSENRQIDRAETDT